VGYLQVKAHEASWMNVTGTGVGIGFAVWALLSVAIFVICKIYVNRKSAEEREMARKRAQDRMDGILKGSDDPNEPARFVP
jgi:hypothetical protein